jgi:hypothetical protein
MRKLALPALALLAAGLSGCYYDRPNPWRTARDVDRLRYKTEHDWMLEIHDPYHGPTTDGVHLTLPDLEGWRDAVLLHADGILLTHMRDQSVQKIAGLEARAYTMAPLNENTKVPIYDLMWQVRVEKVRLGMIEERLGQVGR